MDKNAEGYQDSFWLDRKQPFAFRHRAAIKLFPGGKKVLDVGCGNGLLLERLKADHDIEAFGIDISSEALSQAKKKGIKVRKHDLNEGLPYPDKSFDVIFITDVIEHVFRPQLLLQECARVGKHVIVATVNFNFIFDRISVLFGFTPRNMQPQKAHCYWFNERIFHRMLAECGLKEIRTLYNFPLGTYGALRWVTIPMHLAKNLFATSFTALTKSQV